jgi:hypothetical protein
MTTAVALTAEKQGPFATSWIINKRDDLVWFIGSVATSYLLLAANVEFGVPIMILIWIWALGFDGPHVAATFSRTYADSEERKSRTRLLYGCLVLFLIGPAMVLAGRAELLGTSAWSPAFFFFAGLWAYYHLVKQHYGFMVLYKKKNNDLAEIDNLIDRAFILIGMTYPFVHFLGHGAAAAGRVPFSTTGAPYRWFENLVLFAFIVSLILFVGRQGHRVFLKAPINVPKILLLGAALPMHWIVLRALEPSPQGALAVVAILTIYHNVQYHRIVWFHNENKYVRGQGNYGLASTISRNIWRYAAFVLLFGAAYHVPHYTLIAPNGFLMGFFWGGAFTHYYLDSKIWRVRHDAKLNRNLNMSEPASG